MLDGIRSVYILREILSYLYEGYLLKLVKYSKNYQNKAELNKNNYKGFTGGVILYETNKTGKEYNRHGELIYIGGFLNGERNGEGKEYNNNNDLIYEGEYFKGKKHGKGKEYYDGQLLFEGEYLRGKKWNGEGYDKIRIRCTN